MFLCYFSLHVFLFKFSVILIRSVSVFITFFILHFPIYSFPRPFTFYFLLFSLN
jgi:hypothetical protein